MMGPTTPRGLSAQLRALADFVDAHPRLPFIGAHAWPDGKDRIQLNAVAHDTADVLRLKALPWQFDHMVGAHLVLVSRTPNGITVYFHATREQADALLPVTEKVPA